jgi:iron complex outermembrane receptor protein
MFLLISNKKHSKSMKKNLQFKKKIIHLMKLSLIQICFAMIFAGVSLAKNAEAQELLNRKISVRIENQNFESTLTLLEKEADVKFTYQLKLVPKSQKITLSVNSEPLAQVLDKMLTPLKIKYKVFNNQVVLSRLVQSSNPIELSKPSVLPNSQEKSTTENIIKGIITDEKGEKIPGVNVSIKGTTRGTTTNSNGEFSLDVNDTNAILVVSFIGYEVQEITVGNQSIINIKLKIDNKALEEVVVIGYGEVKKKDVTGSVVTLRPDELNRGLQVTAQDALIGRVAGVNIVPGNGAPGSNGTIRIRMGASLSAGNDPLIVIDGVPVSNTSINTINPNDIATFTILKDASATAIYGSRASNGVIVITTKKGTLNGGTRVSFSSNITVSEVPKYFDVLSTEQFRDAFSKLSNAPASFQLGKGSTNWQKEIYRTAIGIDNNLSINGATKSVPYRVSVGYTNQNGIVKSNNYQRTNVGIGLSPKFLDKHLAFDINIKASIENNRPAGGVIGSAVSFDPTRPVNETYPNNVGLGYYTWMNNGVPIVLAPSNPVADIELSDRLDKTNRSIGNMAVDYKIHGFEDLHLNMNIGYDIRQNNYDENIPQFAPSMYTSNTNDGRGRDYSTVSQNKNYLIDLYANYTKEIESKHTINAMGGYGWQRFWYNTKSTTLDNKGVEIALPTQSEGELYLLSFYGRFNYSYAKKLLLTATLRSDASSRFSEGNRWGYFPSVALGYALNEEKFIRNIKPISNLKLRLSYGQTGQQDIGSYYQHLATYTSSYNDARYLFGNEWLTVYRPNGYDPNIKWETTSTYNAGLDYGFFDNRISGSIDVYKRYTKDLLNSIFVPAGSNFANVIETNIGNMEGQGFEFAISGEIIKNKNWLWTIGGNFNYGTSKITKLNTIDTENSYVKTGSAGGTGNFLQVHKIGETPNSFFLLKQAYDDNGKPLEGKYIAKDGSVTTSEADANKYVDGKSSQIPYYFGFQNRVIYKDWDLGINGHGAFGNYVYNYQEAKQSLESLYGASGVSGNISQTTLKNGFKQQRIYTDYFLESGAFFTFDNVTLGYTINKLWGDKSTLRMALSAQNVYRITKYSGVDPEVFSGIDNNIYQRPRMYSLALNLNF